MKDGDFMLTGRPQILLVTSLPDGASLQDFFGALGTEAEANRTDALELDLTYEEGKQLLRVLRRSHGTEMAFHFSVSVHSRASGRSLKLQPLVAWSVNFATEATEAVAKSTAVDVLNEFDETLKQMATIARDGLNAD